ncbi:MAG: lipid-A-disaccharide synthase [Prevotella sp.]|nr:lipid-A-disaccharide synthase [Prevotella sp.]
MKYYLIVGEASGDLHASHLMRSLQKEDPEAEFRFFGGDLMTAVGGTRVKHYKELAYMGFVPVLLHLRTIFKNMSLCKKDISSWQPDAVILVDYPGFNLKIAKFIRKNHIPTHVYYYISPKIWAWKEYRIKNIKRDVDELFSILPFEVPFFEQKHHYPIHYVGNPTADEVRSFLKERDERGEMKDERGEMRKVIALLAGSRKQEIKDNLPAMLEAVKDFPEYQPVVAGAPSIEDTYYEQFLAEADVKIVHNQTYHLLSQATVALVTSGTATLETALFDVPQVVCYKTPVPHLIRFAFNHIIKCKFISLVNLIADKEVVQELLADRFSVKNIREELSKILPGQSGREQMLKDYQQIRTALGDTCAPDNAARIMVKLLQAPTS